MLDRDTQTQVIAIQVIYNCGTVHAASAINVDFDEKIIHLHVNIMWVNL